jgi:hypothetical protein
MVEDKENDNTNKTKTKKRLVEADRSLAASVIPITCKKCGESYYADTTHYCSEWISPEMQHLTRSPVIAAELSAKD